jgi:hypothetical protein
VTKMLMLAAMATQIGECGGAELEEDQDSGEELIDDLNGEEDESLF